MVTRPARTLEALNPRRRAPWAAVLACLLALASPPAHADSPAPTASPSSTATLAVAGAPVKVRDRTVFELTQPRGDQPASQRAQLATKALTALIEEHDEPEVTVVEDGDTAIVYGGKIPVVQLSAADAQAAGDASLSVHAASVAARLRQGLHGEHQRQQAARQVFSVSLLVFSALIALLLVRKLEELSEGLRERIQNRPGGAPNLEVGGLEVMPASVVLGSAGVALGAGRVLLRVAVAYGWLVFALSLFDLTRPYTARLTGALLAPLSGLVQRLVSAAPLAVVVAVVGFVLLVLLRFLRVFFAGYGEGAERPGWLRADQAEPTGILAQIAVVLVAIVAVLPLVTGDDQGTAGRLGLMALAALGLGVTPLVATVAIGVVQIYGRRMLRGDEVRFAGHAGRVLKVSLIETFLENEQGRLVRIPHLLNLLHPAQVTRGVRLHEVAICVSAESEQANVREVLREVASRHGDGEVLLERIDLDGALYRVRVRGARSLDRSGLLIELADELRRRHVPLGRPPRSVEAA